jgi:hypothetical protein
MLRFFTRNGINAQGVPNILLSLKSIALKDEVGDIERFTKGTTCKIASDQTMVKSGLWKLWKFFKLDQSVIISTLL